MLAEEEHPVSQLALGPVLPALGLCCACGGVPGAGWLMPASYALWQALSGMMVTAHLVRRPTWESVWAETVRGPIGTFICSVG